MGWKVREMFPLAMGGREGLNRCVVSCTSRCGYLSKKLLKLMEDAKIGYCRNVTTAKGNVIQLAYGYDN